MKIFLTSKLHEHNERNYRLKKKKKNSQSSLLFISLKITNTHNLFNINFLKTNSKLFTSNYI